LLHPWISEAFFDVLPFCDHSNFGHERDSRGDHDGDPDDDGAVLKRVAAAASLQMHFYFLNVLIHFIYFP
jgi:hypothetical protein